MKKVNIDPWILTESMINIAIDKGVGSGVIFNPEPYIGNKGIEGYIANVMYPIKQQLVKRQAGDKLIDELQAVWKGKPFYVCQCEVHGEQYELFSNNYVAVLSPKGRYNSKKFEIRELPVKLVMDIIKGARVTCNYDNDNKEVVSAFWALTHSIFSDYTLYHTIDIGGMLFDTDAICAILSRIDGIDGVWNIKPNYLYIRNAREDTHIILCRKARVS